MKKIIIAIDGFSSCGKSTMAKQLAKELGYVFVDSGAMYRAITLFFLRNKIDSNHEAAVKNALQHIHLHFMFNEQRGKSDMYLNNENVENEIRSMLVSDNVSKVSANQHVRAFAVAQQQQMGTSKGIVMDGRDIGTTVFPNAELKIFVIADLNVRAERRLKELLPANPNITIEAVKKNLEQRDLMDSTREFSPLRKAADAIVLDNSYLTKDEQLALCLQWVKEKIS